MEKMSEASHRLKPSYGIFCVSSSLFLVSLISLASLAYRISLEISAFQVLQVK